MCVSVCIRSDICRNLTTSVSAPSNPPPSPPFFFSFPSFFIFLSFSSSHYFLICIFHSPSPLFSPSPIPHSCFNQSHWRICGVFCDFLTVIFFYFYCVCIVCVLYLLYSYFQQQVWKWVRTTWWALLLSSETKPFGDLTPIWFYLWFWIFIVNKLFKL